MAITPGMLTGEQQQVLDRLCIRQSREQLERDTVLPGRRCHLSAAPAAPEASDHAGFSLIQSFPQSPSMDRVSLLTSWSSKKGKSLCRDEDGGRGTERLPS